MRIIDVKAGFAHCQIVIGDVVTIVDVGDATAILSPRSSVRALRSATSDAS